MKGKDAIAQILKKEGVEHISLFPANPLIDACASVGIRPIMGRTERAVVNIADGYSRLAGRGRIGVCAVQESAGAENAFAGVAQAFDDNTPLLILPGHSGRRYNSIPPDFDAVRNYQYVTKWAAQINATERIPDMLRRAFQLLRTGRPGPVLLEVPADVAEEEFDDTHFYYQPPVGPRTAPDPADVTKAVKMLLGAKRPLILAGGGVHSSEAWDELRQFAEALHIPVMTSMNGKSAIADTHPLAVGIGASTASAGADHFLRRSDCLFSVGSSLTKWWMFAPLPGDRPIIQSTIDERDLNKDYPIEHAVAGDAKLVLNAMTEEAKRQMAAGARPESDDPTAEIRAVKEAWLADWMPELTSDEQPLNPYRVYWDLMHTVDRDNTVITHDSGNTRDAISPFWETTVPHSYIGWGHSTQLGFSQAMSIGLKLAQPSKTVINVLGDAGFGMNGMDLETAVRNNVGTLTVLINNSALGNYEGHMPVATELYRLKYLSGDYTKVAEGLGAHAQTVRTPEQIGPAIKTAMEVTKGGRPAVLEVITREAPRFSRYWE